MAVLGRRAFVGSILETWGATLVAIPAGYGIGAWIGTVASFVSGLPPEARAEARDVGGAIGGGVGVVVWFVVSAGWA